MRHPDVVIIMTDEERNAPPYEGDDLKAWREEALPARHWFQQNGVSFERHYTGSLACVPSRPTLFTGHFPDLHGVTQTDGLGKDASDSRMRWLRPGEVPTIGHWFKAAGYDTHYDGKWHITHADLINPDSGLPIPTNTENGEVIEENVKAYLEANPLEEFGFSGWVGPEPHGAGLANSGFIRDNLIAERIVKWLKDRYLRRESGDAEALRPFLLVASFVNPHDIVLFPGWRRQENNPIKKSDLDPPKVPEPPTRHEDLSSKPAAQIAYKNAYFSGYGPHNRVKKIYERNEQAYRDLYYRLHLEVDGPIDSVRKTVSGNTLNETILFRTSDHGDLLGAHGGLHQKWFTLYDEATRVPFQIVRTGRNPSQPRTILDIPTSHVDLIPTALGMAGLEEKELSLKLSDSFTEVHPLPGCDLSPLIENQNKTHFLERSVYMMTRDNMLEGDNLASALARHLGRANNPPAPMKIRVPADVASNFEGIVKRVSDTDAQGGKGNLWKLVRAFDDPSTWSHPGVRQLTSSSPPAIRHRNSTIPDQWELYNLDSDPIELENESKNPALGEVFNFLKNCLKKESANQVPERNNPWPYARRKPPKEQIPVKKPPPPARFLRNFLQKIGLHPEDLHPFEDELNDFRALIVCTNHSWLDVAKPTGVFSSEMTVPYYLFTDAGIEVDLASPLGGEIAIDPMSLRAVTRSHHDDRFLVDDLLKEKVRKSISMSDIDVEIYDVIYFAGGWGASFDLGFSDIVGQKVTEANAKGTILSGVCHGPLGFLRASNLQGRPLVEGRRITGVTDKQVLELGIDATPHHPETELRKLGADFKCSHRFRDPFANHWEVDENLVTGQNQNAAPMVAREIMKLLSKN
ncbi:MAG TPA: sulfatase [Acidimicrobiaceae bacterium]|nr:sulfatase [Acidimicrobiaceae bacterium]